MKIFRYAGLALALVLLLTVSVPVFGQSNFPLENCRGGAFSTEEDFMMTRGEPYDGNPYISDGDVLSPTGLLCARNADLLHKFNPTGAAYYADLGLDAIDIIEPSDRIAAFSTSLDDIFPPQQFTAGDLLFTNGGIIPNSALVEKFGIGYDIGLDAVHFVGKPEAIIEFAKLVPDIKEWGDGRLERELNSKGIDIWFSIEGTYDAGDERLILDGDLLAATGSIVYLNEQLLPNSVPAGLPQRGVDFGLDAVVGERLYDNDEREALFFSTEILFRGRPPFNDGDVLRKGNGVVVQHEWLIQNWHPRADFLGLDALWAPVDDDDPPDEPNIQTMCGDRPVADFDGGIVAPGGAGTGLYYANLAMSPPGDDPRRPCGEYVPIDGFLPDTAVDRFRVAYRADGAGVPAPGTANGIRTRWTLYEWHGWPFMACLPTGSLETDVDGWMDASDYLGAKDGTLTGCANSGLRLAVWDTNDHEGYGIADKNGHYVVWLEWDDGGTLHQEAFEHHLQLDNTLPKINDLELTYLDSNNNEQPLPPCGGASAGTSVFRVNGDFEDDYYWQYRVRIRGGSPPASKYYPWHSYYDGTPEVANTNETGTTPIGSTEFLQEVYMTDLGASFVECCYDLDLWVRDAAIRHSFNHRVANDNSGSSAWLDNDFLTFSASP